MEDFEPTYRQLKEAYDYHLRYADEQMQFVEARGDNDPSRHYNAVRALAMYWGAAGIADAATYQLPNASDACAQWRRLYEFAANKASFMEFTLTQALTESDVHRKICLNGDPPLHFRTEPLPPVTRP